MCKPAIEIIGQRFGKLVVTSRNEKKLNNKAYWNCICDCGNTTIAYTGQLRSGQKQSCGCLVMELANKRKNIPIKHGHATGGKTSITYQSWRAMLQRCYCTGNVAYHRYGGRGITVCDDWINSFEAFLKDVGERPSDAYSLDRIDNNGNYTLANCQWILKTINSKRSMPHRKRDRNGRLVSDNRC